MCDGAGNYCSADHSVPARHQPLKPLAETWLRWATKNKLDKRIMAHIAKANPEPPLSTSEIQEALSLMYTQLMRPLPKNLDPEAEQPYRLQILRLLGTIAADPGIPLLDHQRPPATEPEG